MLACKKSVQHLCEITLFMRHRIRALVSLAINQQDAISSIHQSMLMKSQTDRCQSEALGVMDFKMKTLAKYYREDTVKH